jgi:hypothetical protein
VSATGAPSCFLIFLPSAFTGKSSGFSGLLRRSHDHHRDLRAWLPAKASPHTCSANHPDRHLMTPSPQSTTVVPLAILAGSPPAAPALVSDRQSRPRSHGEYCPAAFDRRVYSCMHRRSLAKDDRVELCAPISSSLTPRPNPHSVRCTAAAHLPRFRALALLGRRPPQRGDGLVMPASEKPAHKGEISSPKIKSDSGNADLRRELAQARRE